MHAYIDESGNTGLNLFDPAQPLFLSLAMSSPVDFDDVFQERVARIARTAGIDCLHGSQLGVGGVESIAPSIIELVECSQVRFHFAFVNKPDVAAIKFFDAVFDPGENPATPHHSYVIRSVKFLLLLEFAAILNPNDARLFWEAMTSPRSPEAESAAVAAIDSVLQRVGILPDARSRQLIGDTLSWARRNIGELSIWTPKKQDRYGHVPNIFTFPSLMEGISKSSKIWHSQVDRIIHDQQSQFSTTLRHWHSLFEDIEPERIIHFGDTPMQFADIRDSQFEVRDSRVSPGLQMADVVLWTFSRVVANKPLGRISSKLYELCFSTEDIFIMSLGWIATEVEYAMSALKSQPMAEVQLQEGKQLMERVEQQRQRRIREASES